MTVRAADIRAALTLRYPQGSHALMFEVAPSTGGGTRYADAVAVGLWNSHGHLIEGIEIKVSRSDLAAELKQPEKSEPVMRYCNHWWLATPKGLADPAELPPNWGLLELCGDRLRVKVRAPRLSPEPVSIGFFASLVRRGANSVTDELAVLMKDERARIEKAVKDSYEATRSREADRRAARVEEGLALLEEIKAKTGIDLAQPSWGQPDWLAACHVLARLGVGDSRRGLSALRRDLARLADTIDQGGLLPAPTTGEPTP